MKKFTFFLALLALNFPTKSQTHLPEALFLAPQKNALLWEQSLPLHTCKTYLPKTDWEQLIVPFDFAKSTTEQAKNQTAVNLQEVEVLQIDLVYSAYPDDRKKWKINYYDLLAKRIESLYQAYPSLKTDNVPIFRQEQTDCKDLARAKALFHGFVIYYKAKTKEIVPDEIKYRPDPPAIRLRVAFADSLQSAKYFNTVIPSEELVPTLTPLYENKKVVMVLDFTSLMYSYFKEILLWHLENIEKSPYIGFVIFNDGDKKTTEQKKIGKTGGIYYFDAFDLPKMWDQICTARTKGAGGDIPENPLEALLFAQKQYPQAEQFVLVADNQAAARDISLLEQLTKKTDVYICKTESSFLNINFHLIHQHYFQIAEKTKGRIFNHKIPYESTFEKVDKSMAIKVTNNPYYVVKSEASLTSLNEFTYKNFPALEAQYSSNNPQSVKRYEAFVKQFIAHNPGASVPTKENEFTQKKKKK